MYVTYIFLSLLAIHVCIGPLLLIYHIIRFLYLRTMRLVWTTQMEYHKRVTRDWWKVYLQRGRLRKVNFVKTDSTCNYALDVRSADIDIGGRTNRPLAITIDVLLKSVTTALVNNEIYLRTAHYSHDGFLGDYTVDISTCVCCSVHLPAIACFLGDHYYCLKCIRTEVLPRFCSERFRLLRATGLIPDELVSLVIRDMVLLSFDHRQIRMAHSQCKCDCKHLNLYDCQRECITKRVVDLHTELYSFWEALRR